MKQIRGTSPLLENLERQGLLMLDGGLATELERRGADLKQELWSARELIRDPASIRDVHLDFLRAGADIVTTATYQASFCGFERAGLSRNRAAQLMRLSVRLASDARDAFLAERPAQGRLRPLVAASIGPYGACLHDGSEYRGDYDLSKQALIDFHRPRMEALAETEADLFAFETIPSLLEAEALLDLISEFEDKSAWLSFSCRDGAHVSHGETFADCAAMADGHPQIAAVGVNCTNPAFVPALLRSAAGLATPLLAYPNSGETWDPESQLWTGEGSETFEVAAWFEAGARLIGGCCRVAPDHIFRMRTALLSGRA